jgi:hypothetical protein
LVKSFANLSRGVILLGLFERTTPLKSLTRRSMSLASKTAQAGMDAVVTIAARTSSLAMPGFDLSGEKARESHMMVQEKIMAAAEGAFAAQMAWGAFLFRAALGGVTTPHHVSHAIVDVAEAAMRPARIAVRANARRLAGTKPFA